MFTATHNRRQRITTNAHRGALSLLLTAAACLTWAPTLLITAWSSAQASAAPLFPGQLLPAGSRPASVMAGDFDGDGDLDLAVANQTSDDVSILLGAGDGSFAAPVNFNAGVEPFSVIAGDYDGDGNLDLAVANKFSNNVSILVNQTNPPPSGAPADLNGDRVVNGSDLASLLTQWGTAGPADLNGDGVVNGSDLGMLLINWGPV